MDSRIFGSEGEQEADFRESQSEQILELKKELGVSSEQLDELVWKAKINALRQSGDFDESKIKLIEDEYKINRRPLTDIPLPSSRFEDFLESSGANRIIGRLDGLGWSLYALKEEKKRRM